MTTKFSKNTSISLILAALLIVLLFLTLSIGSVKLNFKNLDETGRFILFNLRLPRYFSALCTGAILALSGLIFQCVFKNAMADSYVLGVSSASSAFAAISYLIPYFTTFYSVSLFSITGSILSILLLLLLNKNNTNRLLLSGITLNFFFSAISTIILFVSKDGASKILFWTMGSFSSASPLQAVILLVFLFFLFFITKRNAEKMNILLLDDSSAISIGINIKKTGIFLLTTASVCTAVCVSFFGVIGFVGLMSANIIRMITGSNHKKLVLPVSLFGSFITIFADLLAHIVVRPSELPVGLVSAIIGSIVFVLLVNKRGANE